MNFTFQLEPHPKIISLLQYEHFQIRKKQIQNTTGPKLFR
jgi:hypothetical protein